MTATAEELAAQIPERFAEAQHREAAIEEIADEERVIVMRAVPYGVETRLGEGLYESFEPGALARAAKDPARVKFWLGHSTNGGRLVGQAFQIEDRADGAWVHMRVSATPAGDELLTLARDKVLDEASIEFVPIREAMTVERRNGTTIHVRHKRAHFKGVALVPHGAYGRNALVSSVRAEDQYAAALEKTRHAVIAALEALNG